MTRFFVDAFYWIALLSPRDQWHARVRAFNATLAAYHLYTTDEVLTEFLAFYSATDPLLRTRAVGGGKSLHILRRWGRRYPACSPVSSLRAAARTYPHQ